MEIKIPQLPLVYLNYVLLIGIGGLENAKTSLESFNQTSRLCSCRVLFLTPIQDPDVTQAKGQAAFSFTGKKILLL